MPQLVLVFGDSIPMGLWDERGGWPERLWNERDRVVYNLGVDGETSDDVRKRFLSEVKPRANKKSIIVFAVGVNDSSRMNGANRIELSRYIQNMEEMIDSSKRQVSEKILCVGLSPIDQSRTVPFILEKSISFYSKDREEYDRALEEVCRHKGARYISLRNLGIEKHLSEDGVHPLGSGHAIIAIQVLNAITQPEVSLVHSQNGQQILFVCVENAGRSQMAEAFAKKFGLTAESAGTHPPSNVNPTVVEAMKEKGIDISNNHPKLLTTEMVERASLVVTMGCSVESVCPAPVITRMQKKLVDWHLGDPKGKPLEEVRKIRDDIERRVRSLANEPT